MVASNEELQATNEELHATNEELQTVSGERQERIDELAQLNNDVENMLAGSEVSTIFLDRELRIRKFTGQVKGFFDLLPQDIGRPVQNFSHSLDGLDLEALANSVLHTAARQETHEVRSGKQHVLVRALPYTSDQDDTGVVVSFVDVTGLKEAQTRLQVVIDSLAQHVAVLDESGVITMVNRAWQEFASAQGGQSFVGHNYLAVAESDPDARDVARAIRAVLSGERPYFEHEYPCDTATKPLRFLLNATPLQYGHGAVVSHLDITQRVIAEENHQTTMSRYRDLFQRSSAALLLVEPDTLKIVELNPVAATLLGRSTETLVGAALPTFVPEQRHTAWRAAAEEACRGENVSTVLEIIRGDGVERAVTASLRMPEDDPSGLILAELHAVVSDVANTQEMPSRQSQRLESLGTLAGGVAHEMNNILAGIMGLVEASAADDTLKPSVRADLSQILSACERGRDVTRNLLGFARAESPIEAISLRDVVPEVAALARRASGPDVAIEHETEAGLVLKADRSQLVQALLNLSLNGLDAMEGRGGTLRITAKSLRDAQGQQTEHRIAVNDEGCGMRSEVWARAFEPFFTTKPRGEGTGLGLPMVYGVARTLGGRVDVQSEVGVGTTVTLIIPAITTDRKSVPPEKGSLPQLEGNVLIIDDDSLVRSGLASALRRHGMAVTEAESGEDGLRLLREDAFTLVLLDVVMPGMGGIEVLREVRCRQPELPVLLLSGSTDSADPDLAELGPSSFVYKPTTTRELLERMSALLDASGSSS